MTTKKKTTRKAKPKVSPDIAERAKAYRDAADSERHDATALKLRVHALELLVSELTK